MIWPFSSFFGQTRQRQQVADSLERGLAVTKGQVSAAKDAFERAADTAISTSARREGHSEAVREMLNGLVERQSARLAESRKH